MIKQPQRTLLAAAVASVLMSASISALASGFQLFEGSTVNMGDFVAGAVTMPRDGSIGTYNPAGLPDIGYTQLTMSGVGVFIDNQFTGNSRWASSNPNVPSSFTFNEFGVSQGGGGSLVPAFHIVVPYNEQLAFSLNVTSPFGLETDYNDKANTRYSATDSRLITINVSPAFGWRFNQAVSVGAGLDFQYADVDFDSVAGTPGFLPAGHETDVDSLIKNHGNDWDWTWHAGTLFHFNDDQTRVGVNYQGEIEHQLKGRSVLTGPLALNSTMRYISDTLSAKVTLPSTTTVGFYQQLPRHWSLMGSVNYTDWSVFKDIALKNVAGLTEDGSANVPINVVAPQNFDNTVRLSIGAEWEYSDALTLRFGAGIDETPTNSHDRSIRLPDMDRVAIAMGAHFQSSTLLGWDVGYTHFFVNDAVLNNTVVAGGQSVTLKGTVRDNADLIGLQMTMNVDEFMARQHHA